jgi:hypothetical protein
VSVSAARKAQLDERDARIAELYRSGVPAKEIAEREGVSRPLVSLALRKHGARLSKEEALARWLYASQAPAARAKASAANTQSLEERFFSRVVKGPTDDDCWNWTGLFQTNGYPSLSRGRRNYVATHISLELDGRPRPPGMYALHTCDNPVCTNPRHLWWGTQRDNIRDAMTKGRLDLSGLALGLPARLEKCKA